MVEGDRFVLLSCFLSVVEYDEDEQGDLKKEDYGSIERCKSAAFVLEKKR